MSASTQARRPAPAAQGPVISASVALRLARRMRPPQGQLRTRAWEVAQTRWVASRPFGDLSPEARASVTELQAAHREVLNAHGELIARALFDDRLKRSGNDWFAAEARRRAVEEYGAECGRLWRGDAHVAALALGFSVTALPEPELRKQALGVQCYGLARVDERAIFVDEALPPEQWRETVAHEIAHLEFRWVAASYAQAEPLANSFAAGFCRTPLAGVPHVYV